MSEPLVPFDSSRFRQVLGHFTTGVTVVTAAAPDGPVGLAVGSFASVSLDPPLVLWSLAKTSRSMDAFRECDAFAIHILGAHQEELAKRFATRADDKFAELETREGYGRVPLFDDCVAHFECVTENRFEGGDHMIFLGRVVNFEACDHEPLLFHRGSFKRVFSG